MYRVNSVPHTNSNPAHSRKLPRTASSCFVHSSISSTPIRCLAMACFLACKAAAKLRICLLALIPHASISVLLNPNPALLNPNPSLSPSPFAHVPASQQLLHLLDLHHIKRLQVIYHALRLCSSYDVSYAAPASCATLSRIILSKRFLFSSLSLFF